MNDKVLVGSKLPVSLILSHPDNANHKVTIRGLNAAQRGTNGQPIAVPYMVTEVDADFWAAWDLKHGNLSDHPFPSIKSGALFVADTPDAIRGIAREREKTLTGMEGANRAGDVRMGGESVTTAVD